MGEKKERKELAFTVPFTKMHVAAVSRLLQKCLCPSLLPCLHALCHTVRCHSDRTVQMIWVPLGVVLHRTIRPCVVLGSRYAISGKLSCWLCVGGNSGRIYWSPELKKGVCD